MKKEWKDIEGYGVRIDVGSTLQQALADTMPAEVICFTTDNHIVMNGEVFSRSGSEFKELENRIEALEADLKEIRNKLTLS